jgi:hypothetical protein
VLDHGTLFVLPAEESGSSNHGDNVSSARFAICGAGASDRRRPATAPRRVLEVAAIAAELAPRSSATTAPRPRYPGAFEVAAAIAASAASRTCAPSRGRAELVWFAEPARRRGSGPRPAPPKPPRARPCYRRPPRAVRAPRAPGRRRGRVRAPRAPGRHRGRAPAGDVSAVTAAIGEQLHRAMRRTDRRRSR